MYYQIDNRQAGEEKSYVFPNSVDKNLRLSQNISTSIDKLPVIMNLSCLHKWLVMWFVVFQLPFSSSVSLVAWISAKASASGFGPSSKMFENSSRWTCSLCRTTSEKSEVLVEYEKQAWQELCFLKKASAHELYWILLLYWIF